GRTVGDVVTEQRPSGAKRRKRQSAANATWLRQLVERYEARLEAGEPVPDLPGIDDQEVAGTAGPQLVLVRCRNCVEGGEMKGVRRLKDGRVVIGMPWYEVHPGGRGRFPVSCRSCGQAGFVDEATLYERAEQAE